ncbi:glycosyl transferase [Philodulcilactobacillus myokoensis]|uniref:Glycosyl transferase n=1 Tax=Philodulcilactobacillus myokoensis TaxID=2929573 RepID=A0A9W6B2H6_9LACO|nr:CDP-glycerol glycerophosphotransferase family protein [Philodulcilactobacillus myokoensis]GLB46919.1 glycosyl transferase [Philodulcilactobacillus myokoensis]
MLKFLYLCLIRMVSGFFYFRKKSNIIYIMSFGNNLNLIKRMALKLSDHQKIIVLYDPKIEDAAIDLAAFGIKTIPFWNGLHFVFRILPIVMSGKTIFCDNYFPFLGGMFHPKSMKIIQLWHANGAIKKFGWGDPSTSKRSRLDKQRFQAVYNQFDEYVVASKAMGNVFINNYHADHSKIKLLGYPRSDRYLSQLWIDKIRKRVYRVAPELEQKRVILYAPTYRKGFHFNPPIGLFKALSADPNAVVVLRLHPIFYRKNRISYINNPRIHFYRELSTSELLSVTNTLVTDYSSVAFDFSLLPNAHSLIFFMYDLDQYRLTTGIQEHLDNWLPSKPIKNVDDLENAIKDNRLTDFKHFNQVWNTYNDGHATERVVQRYILKDNKGV